MKALEALDEIKDTIDMCIASGCEDENIEAIRQALTEHEWQPIESLPDSDRIILVAWPDGAQRMSRYMVNDQGNGDYWFETTRGTHMVNKIGFTHWTDLPKPPTQGEE